MSATESNLAKTSLCAETNPHDFPTPGAVVHWSQLKRAGFRFLVCYWVLYCYGGPGFAGLPLPFSYFYVLFWQKVSSWFAIHLFHLTGPVTEWLPTGSGDTALHWIYNGCILSAALLTACLWSGLDWRREAYPRLAMWLSVIVRYFLASASLFYGSIKIFPTQFPPPSDYSLVQPFGELTPHGLLWGFMGYSAGYSIFCGAAEVLGGALLLARRTTTFGALVCTGVFANVVALNFFYDTAVKLYSINLLLMAVYLVLSDRARLLNVLVFNKKADDSRSFFEPEFGPGKLTLRDSDGKSIRLTYAMPEPSRLTIKGAETNSTVEIKLRKMDVPTRLMKWRMHWIKPHGYE